MSLTLLLNRTKPVLGTLELDASLQELHGKRVRKTRNPRQDGTVSTDHAVVEPRVVQITGVITNTPDVFGAAFDPRYNDADRHKSAWKTLNELADSRELVDVFTTLESYSNMMLVDLRAPRGAENTNGIQFTAVFEETEIARSLLIENLAADTADLAQAEADLGAQGTTTEAA